MKRLRVEDSQGSDHMIEFSDADMQIIGTLAIGATADLDQGRKITLEAKNDFKIIEADSRIFFMKSVNGKFDSDEPIPKLAHDPTHG